MTEGRVIEINGSYYRVRYRDPGFTHSEDDGLWRCHKVALDWNGNWYCCDDDDYLITDDGQIVAREVGWDLRREEIA